MRFSLRAKSVRARLLAWNITTMAALLLVTGIAIRALTPRILLASIDSDLATRAGVMARHLPPDMHGHGFHSDGPWHRHGPPDFGGFGLPPLNMGMPDGPHGPPPDQNDAHDNNNDSQPDLYRPLTFDQNGQAFGHNQPTQPWDAGALQRALKGHDQYSTRVISKQRVRVFTRTLRSEGAITGVLQIPYPLQEMERAAAGVNRVLLVLSPFALLLAGISGAVLTGRALRPVGEMATSADRINAQELSQRLAVNGADEFSRLAGTINSMLGRLERSFKEQASLVQQLERMVAQIRRFTADASHELKTPLTVIKTNTSFMLQSAHTPADCREVFEEVDEAANSMSRLVQDLLLLSQYDEGQLSRRCEPTSAGKILSAALRRVSNPAGLPITRHIAAGTPCVLADEDELARLFANLIENALRYTPEGGCIRLTVRPHESCVVFQVIDTGIGISPEHLPRLGERFYRIEASRSRNGGGSGLGLAICKSIVEAYDGTLNIESTVGVGTTVTVTLPAAPANNLSTSPEEADPTKRRSSMQPPDGRSNA